MCEHHSLYFMQPYYSTLIQLADEERDMLHTVGRWRSINLLSFSIPFFLSFSKGLLLADVSAVG